MKFFNISCLLLVFLGGFSAYGSDLGQIVPPDIQAQQPDPERKSMELKVGEKVTIPLASSRSYFFSIELLGDAVQVIEYDELTAATVQGFKPGKAILKVYERFWRDPENARRLVQEIAFSVVAVPK